MAQMPSPVETAPAQNKREHRACDASPHDDAYKRHAYGPTHQEAVCGPTIRPNATFM
jgi:hypothetical protein